MLQTLAEVDAIAVADDVKFTDLGYADKFCLVSGTADGLQRLIDAADAWCVAVGRQASPAKTYVMELTSPDLQESQWTCSPKVGKARQPLQVVLQAGYLCVTSQAGKGCLPTFAGLRSKALRAWVLLWQQYGRLACGRSLWLVLQLYQACVVPAGQRNDHGHSACEAWGSLPLRGAARQARAALAALHLQHLKKACGPQAVAAYAHFASRVAAVLNA